MSRRLIMHVGLPKTGTTTIQEFLTNHRDAFAREGTGVVGPYGRGGQHQLGDWLREQDGAHHTPGFFFGRRDRFDDLFPEWGEMSMHLISSEAMYLMGPRGVRTTLDYAQSHGAACEVLVTVRNPLDWVWSRWTQWSKTEPIDWVGSVESVLARREGFVSTTLKHWLESGEIRRVMLVRSEGAGLVERFLAAIGSSVQAGHVPSYNIGEELFTCMYRATLVSMIYDIHRREYEFSIRDAERGFTQRMLLDLMGKADPCRQMAVRYRERVREDPSIGERCIGTGSHGVLAAYSREWAADAREFVERHGSCLDEASVAAVRALAEEATHDARVLESADPFRRAFPQPGFIDAMPIDAAFVTLARSIAMTLLLAQGVWEDTLRAD